jgi:hypothetical protein
MNCKIINSVLLVCLIIVFNISPNYAQTGGDQLWKTSVDWYINAVAPTNDANSDGYSDVFVGSSDNLAYCLSGGGGTKGSIIWSWNYGADVWTVARIQDVNYDNVDECLVGTSSNMIYCMTGKPNAGLTEILWSVPVVSDVLCIDVIKDLNGNGYYDCLVGTNGDMVYCLDGTYGILLWTYKDTKKGAIMSISAISDVNGDGKEDCLAGSENNKVMCISGASSGLGNSIWYYQAGSTILSLTNVEDVTGDGIDDCFAGGEDNKVYCISGNSTGKANAFWSFNAVSTVKSVSSIGDVNSDGAHDCIAGGESDYVYCLSGKTGGQIWSYKTNSSVLSVSSIRDVNGDGIKDCISGGEDDKIYCLNGKTGVLLWSKQVGGPVQCVSSITDLNGNGVDDIIGGSYDSYVYAYEGGSESAQSESISTPGKPSGSSAGTVGQSISVNTSGGTSSLGHAVEYRFDWGNGGLSSWGSFSRSYTYNNVGTYTVKAQTRCKTHTSFVSSWSSGKSVTISGFTLNISISGSGSVQKNPNKSQYNYNELVSLFPSPSSGYQFDHWGGDLSGNANPGYITMSGHKIVTAYFTQEAETVSTPGTPSGPETGSVGSALGFSASGASSNLGHSVEYRFDWGDGNISSWGSASLDYIFDIVNSYSVKAQARCQTHTDVVSGWSSGKSVNVFGFYLSISVLGSGTVDKSPDKAEYNNNEVVLLTPFPAAGYQFQLWTGDLEGNNNPGSVVMSESKSVTANFEETSETVSTPSQPSGSVSGKVGETLSFNTSGSVSNLGHNVEYIFDWDDGSFSEWGSASQNHTYSAAGNHSVKSRARCQTNTGILSSWSTGCNVTLTGHSLTVYSVGQGSVIKNPDKSEYDHEENVTLTCIPASGYEFDHWAGGLTGSNNPEIIGMNADKFVEVHFTAISETVSPPQKPVGPAVGSTNSFLSYSTNSAVSSLGHDIEYRFDWGNGLFSGWGFSYGINSWSVKGNYSVKAQARCSQHTSVVSDWSDAIDVSIQTSGVEQVDVLDHPSHFSLFQNYPNPFNNETTFTFQLPLTCNILFEIFNLSGDLVRILMDQGLPAGKYELTWDGTNASGQFLPSGLYLFRLKAGDYVSMKRMMLLK